MLLAELLKDSPHKLSQFSPEQIQALENNIFTKTVRGKDAPYVQCLVRNKDIKLTPEEAVRQLYLMVLHEDLSYPFERMEVEYSVTFGREKKRADICIFDKDRPTVPYILVELKKPKLKDGKEQLKSYCNATGAPMGVWTNGESISLYQRKDPNYFEDIPRLPSVHEKLSDVLSERWTIDDLIKHDKLVNEKKSLKALILEMEDEVLANAGVDVFEELFKLIFTKLYDEMESGRDLSRSRHLVFRNYGDTETELKDKLQALFDKARDKWEGVFSEEAKIQLTPSHLAVCVSSLEGVKLFNSNLDVVDEAFEYLINKSSKGEKGQYFTPRYVIDMCVKMLNPQAHETLIDTAAGSCGFPVHGIFHVWEALLEKAGLDKSHLFTLEQKPADCIDYVKDKVFAIDFDEKAVRVGRTLNLIAGDGQTNVLHLNTLDFERWDEKTKTEEWGDIYGEGWKKLRKLRKTKNLNQDFNFDVLMANPPFAGDIKETRILAKYELGKKDNGKNQTKLGRDILFIERNLSFLKPGGRMAVVLPQGRFNNSSDKRIREFIAERCRILAVVGLHGNVFKPHTGTKTSVLFVQKWDEKLCPKVEDYPIFFATMQEQSKDNSGDKIYVTKADGSPQLDSHDHLIVKHDLFNHDELTQDGIAEAFIEFGKKENLSFFDQDLMGGERLSGLYGKGFDEGKYRGLLEKLEINEVMLNTLERTKRIDSEFYSIKNINILERLVFKESCPITNFVFVSDGNHMKISDNYCIDGDIPYYRGTDIYNFYIEQSSNPLKIDKQIFNSKNMQRSHLKKGDVLMSIVGAIIGNLSLVKTNKNATCSCKLAIMRPFDVEPSFLAIYLKSYYGQNQIQKFKRGTAQTGLILEDFDHILIPNLSKIFQEKIKKLVNDSYKTTEKSKSTYSQAETLLLKTLGIDDFSPSTENINIKSFQDSFLTTGRLDAEYYQPKYEEIINNIKKFPFKKLDEFIENHSTGYPYKSHDYLDDEKGIPLIRINNIKKGFLDISNTAYLPMEQINLSKKDVAIDGDIVISMSGTIGNTCVIPKNITALINQRILRFTPKNYNSLTLMIIINSIIGSFQLDRIGTGGVQTNISSNDVKKIIIPILPNDTQTQIADLIQQSFALKAESERLLEAAKHAVELAIETDEAQALAYIDSVLAGQAQDYLL